MPQQLFALIVDDDEGRLGGVALQLVRQGVDALYVKNIDEATLLGKQEAGRIGAILLPSTVTPSHLDQVATRVARTAGVSPASIAILGHRPDESTCRALREKGVRWRLWSPFEEQELVFIARAPIWEHRDASTRTALRVPASLSGTTSVGGHKRPVRITDLTAAGAYLETSSPVPAGEQIWLRVELTGEPLELAADLRWANEAQAGGAPVAARPRGMGVEFVTPDTNATIRIQAHVEEVLARFRL